MSKERINLIILNGLNGAPGTILYPSTFIVERIKTLRKLGISPKTYITNNKYSLSTRLGYWLVTRKHLPQQSRLCDFDTYDKENIHVISTKWSVPCALNVKYLCQKVANKIISGYECKSNTILHVHWSYPQGYIGMLIAKKLKIPYIVTTHGSDINEDAITSSRKRKYIITALNNANHSIFVSNDSLNNAINCGFNGISASVIPNGVDLSQFHPVSKEVATMNTKFSRKRKYIVGFIGRLHHQKRADKLPEIFEEIRDRVIDVEFIVIGTGPIAFDIQNKCSLKKIPVTFVDWVEHDNLMYWMNLFDVMILPSRTEGWPCVILEAFACGTPIIASDVGGIPEAMGGFGVIVESGINFEQRFGEAVSRCLCPQNNIDSNALIAYAKRYTWDKTVAKEIEIYQKQFQNTAN